MFQVPDTRPAHEAPPERPGSPVEPRRLLGAVVRARRWLLLAALAGAGGGVAAAKLVVPRRFEASAVLRREAVPGDDEGSKQRALRTLADSVKLPATLSEVRRRLSIETTLGALGKRLDVAVGKESDLLTVTARADDAEASAELAQAVAEVFVERRRAEEAARLDGRVAALAKDEERAEAAARAARDRYDDFRSRNGITSLPAETQIAIEQAARLRAEADVARADARAAAAKAKALGDAASREPARAVLSETELRADQRRLAERATDLAQAQARLTDEHPRTQALGAEVDALGARAKDPRNVAVPERVVGRNPTRDAIDQAYAAAAAEREAVSVREKTLGDLAKESAGRIERLGGVESEAAALLAKARVADKHLEDVRAAKASAEDEARAAEPGVRLVAPAQIPEIPASSLRKLVALAAPVLAVLAALVAALLRELSGLRVAAPSELAYWTGAPVAASTTWPREGGLGEVAGELARVARAADGPLTLVAAGPRERRLARLVARRLRRMGLDDVRESAAHLGEPRARRALRDAENVAVVVASREHGALTLGPAVRRVARDAATCAVLVDVGPDLASLTLADDRVGDAAALFRAPRRREPTREEHAR